MTMHAPAGRVVGVRRRQFSACRGGIHSTDERWGREGESEEYLGNKRGREGRSREERRREGGRENKNGIKIWIWEIHGIIFLFHPWSHQLWPGGRDPMFCRGLGEESVCLNGPVPFGNLFENFPWARVLVVDLFWQLEEKRGEIRWSQSCSYFSQPPHLQATLDSFPPQKSRWWKVA